MRALLPVLVAMVVTTQLVQIWQLRSERVKDRELLLQAIDSPGPATAERARSIATAFDRTTKDIYFAVSGPYLLLVLIVPYLLANLARFSARLLDVEKVLFTMLNAEGPRWRMRN